MDRLDWFFFWFLLIMSIFMMVLGFAGKLTAYSAGMGWFCNCVCVLHLALVKNRSRQ